MQRHLSHCSESLNKFQSSPDPEAGCNLVSLVVMTQPAFLFQSSPDPEAGCNKEPQCYMSSQLRVSILTRPGGRVQP